MSTLNLSSLDLRVSTGRIHHSFMGHATLGRTPASDGVLFRSFVLHEAQVISQKDPCGLRIHQAVLVPNEIPQAHRVQKEGRQQERERERGEREREKNKKHRETERPTDRQTDRKIAFDGSVAGNVDSWFIKLPQIGRLFRLGGLK